MSPWWEKCVCVCVCVVGWWSSNCCSTKKNLHRREKRQYHRCRFVGAIQAYSSRVLTTNDLDFDRPFLSLSPSNFLYLKISWIQFMFYHCSNQIKSSCPLNCPNGARKVGNFQWGLRLSIVLLRWCFIRDLWDHQEILLSCSIICWAFLPPPPPPQNDTHRFDSCLCESGIANLTTQSMMLYLYSENDDFQTPINTWFAKNNISIFLFFSSCGIESINFDCRI